MQILVTHLTRMKSPYICVAGVDERWRHRRPVLADSEGGHRQLERNLLRSKGGHFALGERVDLGSIQSRPAPPQIEDVVFEPAGMTAVKTLDPADFLRHLHRVARNSLRTIFGLELEGLSRTAAAVPEGSGSSSLGVLGLSGASLQVKSEYEKQALRFDFEDPDLGELSLKVTDLRLWESDHETPAADAVDRIKNHLDECFISVGLGRAYDAAAYPGPKHYLQVNNIYPRSDPLWERE